MIATTASGWLLHTLAGGGLLLLLAWVWTAWTRQPARRLRVAEWAMAAALLLAVLSLGPAWLVMTTPAPVSFPIAERQRALGQESRAPAPPAPVLSPTNRRPPAPPLAPAPAPAEPAPHSPEGGLIAAPLRPWWAWDCDRIASVAVALYLAVGAALLGRWLLGWLALRRLLGRCGPVTGRAACLFAEMAGDGPRPRLLASPRARAPFSCGLLRPTVVLPAELCETASDEALRWVLAHELAHLERRDAWSGMLFALGQGVYFAVPWFWRLRRQARLCQEYLADAAAAEAGGRPEDYAQFLLTWTTAPRPPVGACGVWGRSSDLFWRVKTMLQSPIPLERRCPRRWSLTAACGLLSAAVLAAGFTLKAAAEPPKDQPKKEEPKKVEPKADPAPAVPDLPGATLDDLLKNFPGDADQLKMLRARMQEAQERLRKAMEQQRQNGAPSGFDAGFGAGLPGFPGSAPREARLGVSVEKPGDTLAEQLELPKDQGFVIRDVMADSAAARAGLKAHDILLELDGKAVTSDPAEFRKTVDGIKADAPVDAVVLRKGRKETIKGLSLPEAKAAAPGVPPVFPNLPLFPDGLPGVNLPALPPGAGAENNAGNGVTTTTVRTNDHFSTRHKEGGLTITVTGQVADGKAAVSEVKIKDGAESHSYDSVDAVPEKYRDTVKGLVEMSEKGSVKVEAKAP